MVTGFFLNLWTLQRFNWKIFFLRAKCYFYEEFLKFTSETEVIFSQAESYEQAISTYAALKLF